MSGVCLILEGTYPYVTGGVSSCVYQLLRETPNVNYFIIYIGAQKESGREYKYPIPSNVEFIQELTLFDYNIHQDPQKIGLGIQWSKIHEFHNSIKSKNFQDIHQLLEKIFNPFLRNCDPEAIFTSEQAWQILREKYMENEKGPSFIDYFYTWRFTHFPIFQILKADIPKASLYHSLSTGYAGLLGAMAKIRYNAPFILTEHGIYTNERKIEISLANWIQSDDEEVMAIRKKSFFKNWWLNMFQFMSSLAYSKADIITTLFHGNKTKQIQLGADPRKIRIIPNGINFDKFSNLPLPEKKANKPIVALIGRIVPIKDIKTFIKAIDIVRNKKIDFQALVIGPTDEDPIYYKECKIMTQILGLTDHLIFTGKVNVMNFYPKIDLMVLSSISEGQPMVIIEGFCQKIPVVATNVGACSELIFGGSKDDQELGPAGAVVPFGDPEAIATKVAELLINKELREQYGKNGKERVAQFYQEKRTINNYLSVYNELLAEGWN